ncbi:hypothetical protein [Bacillus sp. Marseille-P3661]|nr:hypothetical protein [Bacillus sp. Marseille-P3661]
MARRNNKTKKVQGKDMTNLELGNELGGGTHQAATQINQLKKAKKTK